MIPSLPSFATIVTGVSYALRMALRQAQPAMLLPTSKAIWDALWFRFLLVLGNGIVMLGFDHAAVFPLLALIALVDTLSYPVISQFALQLAGYGKRFPLFILAMTWIGNLRVMILMVVLLSTGGDSVIGNFALFVVALWMIWATWSVASQSLGNKGLAGAGMVILMMVVEMINASVIIQFIHPLVGAGQ